MSINLCLILEHLNLRVNVRLYGFLVVSSAIIMKYLPQTNYRQMWSEIKFWIWPSRIYTANCKKYFECIKLWSLGHRERKMKLFLPVVSATLSNPSWKVTKEVTGIEVRGAQRLNLAELLTFFEPKQNNGIEVIRMSGVQRTCLI